MLPEGGGDIHVLVGVMNAMKLPACPRFMQQNVSKVRKQVQRYNSQNEGQPRRKVDREEQSKLFCLYQHRQLG